jgi:hypothetical protein
VNVPVVVGVLVGTITHGRGPPETATPKGALNPVLEPEMFLIGVTLPSLPGEKVVTLGPVLFAT